MAAKPTREKERHREQGREREREKIEREREKLERKRINKNRKFSWNKWFWGLQLTSCEIIKFHQWNITCTWHLVFAITMTNKRWICLGTIRTMYFIDGIKTSTKFINLIRTFPHISLNADLNRRSFSWSCLRFASVTLSQSSIAASLSTRIILRCMLHVATFR